MPKWLKIALVVLVVYFIIKTPIAAAATAKHVGSAGATAGSSVITFLNALLT